MTCHSYVLSGTTIVPGGEFWGISTKRSSPEQISTVESGISGLGYTLTVISNGSPEHSNPVGDCGGVGVTEYLTVCTIFKLFFNSCWISIKSAELLLEAFSIPSSWLMTCHSYVLSGTTIVPGGEFWGISTKRSSPEQISTVESGISGLGYIVIVNVSSGPSQLVPSDW